jgi:hypothetical protein
MFRAVVMILATVIIPLPIILMSYFMMFSLRILKMCPFIVVKVKRQNKPSSVSVNLAQNVVFVNNAIDIVAYRPVAKQ